MKMKENNSLSPGIVARYAALHEQLSAKFKSCCYYCGQVLNRDTEEFDSILPTSVKHNQVGAIQRIGYFESLNRVGLVALVCRRCNVLKGAHETYGMRVFRDWQRGAWLPDMPFNKPDDMISGMTQRPDLAPMLAKAGKQNTSGHLDEYERVDCAVVLAMTSLRVRKKCWCLTDEHFITYNDFARTVSISCKDHYSIGTKAIHLIRRPGGTPAKYRHPANQNRPHLSE